LDNVKILKVNYLQFIDVRSLCHLTHRHVQAKKKAFCSSRKKKELRYEI
jgi:hypothetical protein